MKRSVLITGITAAAAGALMLIGFGQDTMRAEAALTQGEPAIAMSPGGSTGPYAPQDECASLPGFAAFRSAIFAAVEAKDTQAMLDLAHPGIELDFGGGAGLDEFERRLDADDMLWTELADLNGMGCASDSRDETVMPWVFERWTGPEDPFAAMLANGEGIAIRAEPRGSAPIVGRRSYSMVELAGHEGATDGFYEILLPDGRTGYVAEQSLRPVLGYRIYARRGPGGWMIESFLAGD